MPSEFRIIDQMRSKSRNEFLATAFQLASILSQADDRFQVAPLISRPRRWVITWFRYQNRFLEEKSEFA